MSNDTTKRHARTRRGCLTCRIRKKKCDSLRPSCTKCNRLHVQCLGYASDRPDWLKGDCAKRYTTAIKCFLSEYPAAKAYNDPVPFLVLKSTPELEQWLAQNQGGYNPFYFDPGTVSLRRWSPSGQPSPSSAEHHGGSFPGTSASGEAHPINYPSPEEIHRPNEPLTPSPEIPYTYPPGPRHPPTLEQDALVAMPWMYNSQNLQQSFPIAPYVPSQQHMYDYDQQAIATSNNYNLNDYPIHHVGPNDLARQDSYAFAPSKARFDETGASVTWLF